MRLPFLPTGCFQGLLNKGREAWRFPLCKYSRRFNLFVPQTNPRKVLPLPYFIDKGTRAQIGYRSKSLGILRGILVNALNQPTTAKPIQFKHFIPVLEMSSSTAASFWHWKKNTSSSPTRGLIMRATVFSAANPQQTYGSQEIFLIIIRMWAGMLLVSSG